MLCICWRAPGVRTVLVSLLLNTASLRHVDRFPFKAETKCLFAKRLVLRLTLPGSPSLNEATGDLSQDVSRGLRKVVHRSLESFPHICWVSPSDKVLPLLLIDLRLNDGGSSPLINCVLRFGDLISCSSLGGHRQTCRWSRGWK